MIECMVIYNSALVWMYCLTFGEIGENKIDMTTTSTGQINKTNCTSFLQNTRFYKKLLF